jgi:hypothetical protein
MEERLAGEYTLISPSTPLGYVLILPRSRHRPVAIVEGSLTENVKKIGVRLWTDRSAVSLSAPQTNLVISAAFIGT